MRQIADRGIDRRDAGPAIDRALADVAARIDPKPQEHRRAARPLLEEVAREIATGEHRRDEMRGFGNAIVPAAARSVSAGTASGARADAAGASTGTCNWG